jgi:PAP2 superfamily
MLYLRNTIFYIFLFITSQSISQQKVFQSFKISDSIEFSYKKPTFFEIIKYVPKDILQFGQFTAQKENLFWSSASLASTLVLIPLDQQLSEEAIDLGKGINWDKDHSYSKVAGVFRIIPNDINSAVYYIGNGGTTMLLSGAFYAFGKINKDYRALNTSNELIEVLLSVGVVTQTIKRITGRQSPSEAFMSGNSGGHWTPFPSFKAYQTNTPNYDAMPSGHVATFMATLTVISTNYPEIKWIKPVGYSLLGIMAFEMVSSKVHWVSDYPLAILIGYAIGKNAANRRIVKRITTDETGAVIEPKFKTAFCFNFTPEFKTLGFKVSF